MPEDPRFSTEPFVNAPAIFPNNDVKYDVNKRRARLHATTTKQAITWVQAKDKPTPEVLRERPDLVAQKIRWLSYHDRDCASLYGMLPLIKGIQASESRDLGSG